MSSAKGKQLEPTKAEVDCLLRLRSRMLTSPAYVRVQDEEACVTWWEELGGIGLNFATRTLCALVRIHRASGYGNRLPGQESREYVRFFLQDGAGNFRDFGAGSCRLSDVSETEAPDQSFNCLVRVPIAPSSYGQLREMGSRIKLRAVLSWNFPPSSNPEDKPLFGNCMEGEILLEKDRTAAAKEQGTINEVPVTEHISEERFTYAAVHQLFQTGASERVNLDQILSVVNGCRGNTAFEELTCLGLCAESGTIAATLRLKKSRGFSESVGAPGTKEYVTFWADCDRDDAFEEYLGTVEVEVCDVPGPLPSDGFCYSVSVPVSENISRLKSSPLAPPLRVRAVLSWAVPPSPSNPEVLGAWGNRFDAQVSLHPTVSPANDLHEGDPEFLSWLTRLRPALGTPRGEPHREPPAPEDPKPAPRGDIKPE